MKLIFLCSYYPQYLENFYSRNKYLTNAGYDEQMNAISNDFFGVYTSYVEFLRKKGVDAQLIIPNCKELQTAWAREHGVPVDDKWEYKIPIEQVKLAKPDIFYLSSMFEYYGPFLDEVKSYARNIFGWIACEIPSSVNLKQVQLLFSAVPYFVERFRNEGIHSEFLHAAFNPAIHEKVGETGPPDIDFSFIGSLSRAHQNRIAAVKKLMRETNMQFIGSGTTLLTERKFWHRFFPPNPFPGRIKPSVWGIDMFRTLKRSRITFNSHIDVSKEFIGNMRMYEATGMGTLLLTDGKNAPAKNFTDDEVVYYDSTEDAIEKVKYYLNNEHERQRIASNGQRRTLKDYNYDITTDMMLAYFRKYMK